MKKKYFKYLLLLRKWGVTPIFLLMFCPSLSQAITGGDRVLERINATISLSCKEASPKEILEIIEKRTDFVFSYGRKLKKEKRRFSFDIQNKSVKAVLDMLTEEIGLQYYVANNNISVKMDASSAINKPSIPVLYSAESLQQAITGVVFDENGQPMPGVSVVVKGTTKGVVTDLDGKFSINVADETAVLLFSYVGYKNSELPAERNMRITMQEEAQALSDVVVVGYGTQSKAKVTGAVGSIEAKSLQQVASVSLEQQIAGKMSGVTINQGNGQPGAASQIVIRGTGTLTAGTNPLIVVDGFPLTEGSTLNSVNPNDIQSLDILKDAASAAIYGSRGANGVILVTTKRGVASQKVTVMLDAYGGIQEQSSGVKLVDAYDFATFLNEARNWGYASKDPANRNENDPNSVRVTKGLSGKPISGRELSLDEKLGPYLRKEPGLTNTNWMNEVFRAAKIQNYTLSFSGGANKTTYYSSLGYFDQEGVILGTGLKRYSGALRLETELHERVKVGINIKAAYADQNVQNQNNWSDGTIAKLPLSYPFYKPYKSDGSLNLGEQLADQALGVMKIQYDGARSENIVATILNVDNKQEAYRTFGNIFANVDILKGLSYRLSLGGDYDSYRNNYYYPSDIGAYRAPAPRADANSSQKRQDNINYLVENTINYRTSFDAHNITVLAGHTFQKEKVSYIDITGTGFLDNNIRNIAGASAYSTRYNLDMWALESYLGRIQYDYDSKYLFSAAVRTDGSSRFGQNNRWGVFPSASAGWIISKEEFFPKNNILTFAKISASWGQTGNNQIGNYASQALVTQSNYVFGRAIAPGYITTTAANPNLGWEIASSTNIGLDMVLLKNHISLSMAYYNTQRNNLLLNVPIPEQTGYSNVLTNIGAMENKGFEFQLGANNIRAGDFILGLNANLTTYENKVLALGPGQERIADGDRRERNFITQIGRPIAEIYTYQLDGVYKSQAEIDSSPHLNGTMLGDHRVVDTNKDNVIDEKDKVSKGTYAPKYTYGFGANVSYKGFSFNFNFMGVGGRTLLDNQMRFVTEPGEGFGVPSQYYFDNRYHPVSNPDGFLGRPNFGNFSQARLATLLSSVVEENNGDYLRLRDVRLAYDFNKKLLSKMKLSNFQIYLSGNNLFTITKYRGWNPDAVSPSVLTSGNAGYEYPIARTVLLGIKITY